METLAFTAGIIIFLLISFINLVAFLLGMYVILFDPEPQVIKIANIYLDLGSTLLKILLGASIVFGIIIVIQFISL